MGSAEDLSVSDQMCVYLTISQGHDRQRQVVCSIVGHCENACSAVVGVTNVTDDFVKDNRVAWAERWTVA